MSDPVVTTLKPGIQTSEFATMVITQVIGLFVLSGKVTPTDAPILIQYIVMLVAGAQMIFTAVSYIVGRLNLKKTIVESATAPTRV